MISAFLGMILGLINLIIALYMLCVVAYVITGWLQIPANQWTVLLARVAEPALQPVRRLMNRYVRLPGSLQRYDLSPLVLLLILEILRKVVFR